MTSTAAGMQETYGSFVRAAKASAAMAVVACVALILTGHPLWALGLAAGVVIGAANGYFAQRSVGGFAAGGPAAKRRFVISAMRRLAIVTAVALAVAVSLGRPGWLSLAGIAGFQVVMVLTAARSAAARRAPAGRARP